MPKYEVSICLIIEAKDEEEATNKFIKKVNRLESLDDIEIEEYDE